MDEAERKLDRTTTSMDKMALNNMINEMRGLVKKAKLYLINKHAKQIKVLQGKKGDEKQKAANLKKNERLVEEIRVAKKLDVTKVAKFALGNTLILDKMNPMDNMETWVMVRVSQQTVLDQYVKKFRSQHSDWKALAAFLVQHTGRRLKKKKNKDVAIAKSLEKSHHSSGIVDSNESPSTNLTLKSSSKIDGIKKKAESDASGNDSSGEGSDTSHNDMSDEDSDKIIQTKKDSASSHAKRDDESSSVGSETVKLKSTGGQVTTKSKAVKKLSSDIPVMATKVTKTSRNMDTIKTESVSANVNANPGRSKETVVKKLHLDTLKDEAIELPQEDSTEGDCSFLFQPTGDEKPKKKRDVFFISEDGAADDEDGRLPDANLLADSSDEEAEYENRREARQKMETTFMGSLTDKRKPNWRGTKVSDKGHQRSLPYQKPTRGGKTLGLNSRTKPGAGKPASQSHNPKQDKKATSAAPPEKLHPSWEASRKKKEQQSFIGAFTGKKTTFDD